MGSHLVLKLQAGMLLVLASHILADQRTEHAAAFVSQQHAEERYRRLYAIVEDLQTANLVLQKRIESLESQLQRTIQMLEEKHAEAISTKQLDTLGVKLREDLQAIEDRRVADNQKILEELRQLAKRPLVSSDEIKNEIKTSEAVPESSVGSVYEIRVEPGYTLSAIAKKYRDEGHSVSVEDILRINPGLDPRRLQPGQIIHIPAQK